MKKEYHLGVDFFLFIAVVFLSAGAALRFFGKSLDIGFTVLVHKDFAVAGVTLLLINIALSLQEIARHTIKQP